MTATEKLNALACEFARQKDIVTEQYNSLAAATILMAKWGETRFVDAVSREAKARAIKAMQLS